MISLRTFKALRAGAFGLGGLSFALWITAIALHHSEPALIAIITMVMALCCWGGAIWVWYAVPLSEREPTSEPDGATEDGTF